MTTYMMYTIACKVAFQLKSNLDIQVVMVNYQDTVGDWGLTLTKLIL